MAVRTAYAPVAGTVITAANHVKFPGGWIGYNEVTANQTPITSITDATGLSLTVTAGTSRKVKITGYVGFQSTVGTDIGVLQITDGSNVAVNVCNVQCNLTTVAQVIAHAQAVLNPSSGSNTWKLRVARGGGGSGTLALVAAATTPSFVLVEDIGPSA
jgi:hypothetical protein